MYSLPDGLRHTAEKYHMIKPGMRVLCALSGGADSVVMTHGLAALAEALGITLAAAHFSHGIRPDAAETERQLCQSLCNCLGIPLFCGEGDTPAHASRMGISVEAAARELRYGFLDSAAVQWQGSTACVIATAHNLEDQAETVLMNLVRGAGLEGLGGIRPVAGRFIRPLIETSRADIEAYAAANGLDYAIDRTNLCSDYTRNKIRNQVMPLLRQINPRAAESISRTGFLLRLDSDYIGRQAGKALEARPLGEIDAAALAAAHPALASRMVLQAAGPRARRGLTSRHVQAVIGLAGAQSPSGSVDLPMGLAAVRQYGAIFIRPRREAGPHLPGPVKIDVDQAVEWAGWRISISRQNPQKGWCFDDKCIGFPIEIRARTQGDRICMGNYHKNVKKMLIERKIPKNLRDNVPVLCDNNGVLCVGNLQADLSRIAKGSGGQGVFIAVEPATGDF